MSKTTKTKFAEDPHFKAIVQKFTDNLHNELNKKEIPLKLAEISFAGHPDCVNPGCKWICSLDPLGNPINCHCEC